MPGLNLTANEAAERAATITDVASYAVILDLSQGEEVFGIQEEVRFTATPGASTFIDFNGKEIVSATLNGAELDPASYADSRLPLPSLAAENVLTIEAVGLYTNTGEGLHRFVDPADDEVYLYTQFETADSRRMYPVFEQPDLKSAFQFTVTAPEHWEVISNEPTPTSTPATAGFATWAFTPTPRMSSYITALVAGPFDVVRGSITSRKGEIPAGVFCRKSLREFLEADEFIDIAQQGFTFYEKLFDQDYPFNKYDQILAPEYNAGAMENAGCVTFHEMFIYRGNVPESERELRAEVILHELAHMWFGNLVTMKWWSDLWLNESFADWCAATSLAEATRYTNGWVSFASGSKAAAARADQLSTTHPIVATIADLRDAETNFDAITYSKGASVLKQMVAYVGREAFEQGLRAYFRKHAWGNTVLDDLLVELSAASGRDMAAWSRQWLETAGINALSAQITTDDQGVITAAHIKQAAIAEQPTLRSHRIVVGCYRMVDGELRRAERVEMDVVGELTEVPELVGLARPDLVLLNDEDLDYTKFRLDDVSLATFAAAPEALTDPMATTLVLGAMWDMCRDAEMPASQFVPMITRLLPTLETTVVDTILMQMWLALSQFTETSREAELRDTTVAGLRAHLDAAEAGSSFQLQMLRAVAETMGTQDDAAYVRTVLDGDVELPGLSVDQDLRWHLVTHLARLGVIGEAEVAAEEQKDKTVDGAESAARARAALPGVDAKRAVLTDVLSGAKIPTSMLSARVRGFRDVRDPEDVGVLAGEFFAQIRPAVEKVFADGGGLSMARPMIMAFPTMAASPQLLDQANEWLASNTDAPNPLVRVMMENRDAVARALAARDCDALG